MTYHDVGQQTIYSEISSEPSDHLATLLTANFHTCIVVLDIGAYNGFWTMCTSKARTETENSTRGVRLKRTHTASQSMAHEGKDSWSHQGIQAYLSSDAVWSRPWHCAQGVFVRKAY